MTGNGQFIAWGEAMPPTATLLPLYPQIVDARIRTQRIAPTTWSAVVGYCCAFFYFSIHQAKVSRGESSAALPNGCFERDFNAVSIDGCLYI
jgi:hypothetical protein